MHMCLHTYQTALITHSVDTDASFTGSAATDAPLTPPAAQSRYHEALPAPVPFPYERAAIAITQYAAYRKQQQQSPPADKAACERSRSSARSLSSSRESLGASEEQGE